MLWSLKALLVMKMSVAQVQLLRHPQLPHKVSISTWKQAFDLFSNSYLTSSPSLLPPIYLSPIDWHYLSSTWQHHIRGEAISCLQSCCPHDGDRASSTTPSPSLPNRNLNDLLCSHAQRNETSGWALVIIAAC